MAEGDVRPEVAHDLIVLVMVNHFRKRGAEQAFAMGEECQWRERAGRLSVIVLVMMRERNLAEYVVGPPVTKSDVKLVVVAIRRSEDRCRGCFTDAQS